MLKHVNNLILKEKPGDNTYRKETLLNHTITSYNEKELFILSCTRVNINNILKQVPKPEFRSVLRILEYVEKKWILIQFSANLISPGQFSILTLLINCVFSIKCSHSFVIRNVPPIHVKLISSQSNLINKLLNTQQPTSITLRRSLPKETCRQQNK